MRLQNVFAGIPFHNAWDILQRVLNGSLDVENMRWKLLDYTSNVTPDTEDLVPHTLGRVPIGFMVLSIDKPGTVYKSNDFGPGALKLKCSAASANVRLMVL